MTRKNFKGIAFAMISSGAFGLIPLFSIPLMKEGMSTQSILFYRFLISALLMGGICLLGKENFKIPRRHVVTIFFFSVLYALTALLLMYSYNFIPSGVATTIHFLYPILVSILMIIFFKEKRSSIILIAAVLSLLGVLLLSWTDTEHIRPVGILIALGTVVTYSSYIVCINQMEAGHLRTEILTFYILLFDALLFGVFCLCTTGFEPIPSSSALARLIGLGFFATVVSDFTLVIAIKLIGSTTTSILGSMEPVVAVTVGVLYFSEHFDIFSLIGILLILFSVTLVVLKTSKKQEAPPLETPSSAKTSE